jgi:hypothetical protein
MQWGTVPVPGLPPSAAATSALGYFLTISAMTDTKSCEDSAAATRACGTNSSRSTPGVAISRHHRERNQPTERFDGDQRRRRFGTSRMT